MTVQEWLKDVYYDVSMQFIFAKKKNKGVEAVAGIRGFGSLSKEFPTLEETYNFQDQVGKFIAEAINEKIERLKQQNNEN